MAEDGFKYELMVENALRQVVREALNRAADRGLPGQHHFYITFRTDRPDVTLPERLRSQYPKEMTIVLQHQFWDLVVTEAYLEVGLSFNGITEKLHVPLEAIKGFFDPSVQFGLQFETLTEGAEAPAEKAAPAAVVEEKAAKPRRKSAPADVEPPPAIGPAEPAKPVAAKGAPVAVVAKDEPAPERPAGAEVVRLDRFRKK